MLRTIGAKGSVLPLPQDDPNVFHAFHKWLYTRKLSDNLEDSKLECIDLFKIYVYGDLRDAPGLKNAAMDAIIKDNSISGSYRTPCQSNMPTKTLSPLQRFESG